MAKSSAATKTTTAAKVTPAPVKKVTLVDRAKAQVIDIFTNKIEGLSSRQRCLTAFEELGMVEPTTRQTYFNNIITQLRNVEAEQAQVALEKNKPVWSAFKVNGDNIVTSVGLFITAGSAQKFNEIFEHHGVMKGALTVGDVVEPKAVKRPVSTVKKATKAVTKTATPKAAAKKAPAKVAKKTSAKK